jgi:hypothetical protein
MLGEADVRGVYFAEAGASGYRKLTSDLSRAAYDPRGYLLFVRAGVLVAQRFDPLRGALDGDPSPVSAHGVGESVRFGVESWFSVAPGVVAYRPGGLQTSRLVWIDRAGGIASEVASPGPYMEAALSRDGRKVVAQRMLGTGRIGLWVFDTGAHDRGQPLTTLAESTFSPVWSPDSKSILYRARGGAAKGGTLARRAASGTGTEEVFLSGGPERCFLNDWSPDGRTVLFEQYGESTGSDVWALEARPPHKVWPVLQGAHDEAHARFSPDGRLFAYTSAETGLPQVFVQTFPPSGARWQISPSGGDQASWRADGRELFYVSLDRVLHAVPVLSLEPLEVGPAEPLGRLRIRRIAPTGLIEYAPSPDGRRFLVNWTASDEASSTIDVVLNWASRGPAEGAAR